MLLNERLTTLRSKAGLTQVELGAKLNISAQAISKWESGTSEPDITTLTRLAIIYGLSLAELTDPDSSLLYISRFLIFFMYLPAVIISVIEHLVKIKDRIEMAELDDPGIFPDPVCYARNCIERFTF